MFYILPDHNNHITILGLGAINLLYQLKAMLEKFQKGSIIVQRHLLVDT